MSADPADLKEEAQILADGDRRADANFLLLDAMEAEAGAPTNTPGNTLLS